MDLGLTGTGTKKKKKKIKAISMRDSSFYTLLIHVTLLNLNFKGKRIIWTPRKKNEATQKGKRGQYQVAPDSSMAIFTSEGRGVRLILRSVAYEPAALASLGSSLEARISVAILYSMNQNLHWTRLSGDSHDHSSSEGMKM